MKDSLDELLGRDEVIKVERSSPPVIDALSKHFTTTFPESLFRLWDAGDNIALETIDAHIPGATEILQLIDEGAWSDPFVEGGFIPVLDDHQSNYLVVIIYAPLAPRIAYLPHDDGGRLLYRDLDGFAKALLKALDAGESADLFFHETQGDYPPDAPRSRTDQDAARALLATDGTREEWNYATQLLDASNLAEWAKLLETDHFVRRDVIARMQQMHAPAIRELLRRDRLSFDAFARATAEAARRAGLKVGERRQAVLQIGGKWMNLESFFHRRNIPNAMPRMIAWFEDLIAGRNPHDRAGHFMAD
ncbi:MAG: hypothetical protein ACRELG_17030 [Gemmataceae bacterium]